MKRQRALDAIILEKRLAARDFLKNLSGKIIACEEQAKLSFIQHRIVQQGQQHARGGVMEENGQVLAGCGQRAFTILREGIHGELATGVSRRTV
jgi:hypothetical protein